MSKLERDLNDVTESRDRWREIALCLALLVLWMVIWMVVS